MQVVEMGVGYQDNIDRRQVPHSKSRTAQTFEDKKPAGEVGIDHRALPAQLQKEAGMADESYAQLSVRGQARLVCLPGTRRDGGVADEPSELRCAFAESPVVKLRLDHQNRPKFLPTDY